MVGNKYMWLCDKRKEQIIRPNAITNIRCISSMVEPSVTYLFACCKIVLNAHTS